MLWNAQKNLTILDHSLTVKFTTRCKTCSKKPVLNMPFVMYCATSTMNNSVKNY